MSGALSSASPLRGMEDKLKEGDSIAMQGEVTMVHTGGRITVWLHGYTVPLTIRSEHVTKTTKSTRP